MFTNSGGSVLLSNVDDYLSPSQACVNPLYAANDEKNEQQGDQPPLASISATDGAAIVPKQRRQRRRVLPNTNDNESAAVVDNTISTSTTAPAASNKVTASIVDCLACSGCVTTAETVLLESHSLDKLRNVMQYETATNTGDNNEAASRRRKPLVVVATVSPAAVADLVRMMLQHAAAASSNTSESHELQENDDDDYTQLVIRLLIRLLKVDVVLDGNVALEWSLQEAAREFMQRYKPRQGTLQSTSTTTINTTIASPSSRTTISSTCPAVVCLVEKNAHDCVPLLSTTKSAFGAAAQAMNEILNDVNDSHDMSMHDMKQDDENDVVMHDQSTDADAAMHEHPPDLFHLAVMPCHDKKLEASRLTEQHVDGKVQTMVITTEECWQLLLEQLIQQQQASVISSLGNVSQSSLLRLARTLVSPTMITSDWKGCLRGLLQERRLQHDASLTGSGYFITSSTREHDVMKVDIQDERTMQQEQLPSSPFVYTSGGYADYIFKRAARDLYGVHLSHVPWRPSSQLMNSNDGVMSARVARSRRQQRDYYEAILYQRVDSSSGLCEYTVNVDISDDTSNSYTPVLRFAMAHGMQTMQRAISEKVRGNFDYIEAMACPSGCLNGGGQVMMQRSGSVGREAPRDTQARLQAARRHFVNLNTALDEGTISGADASLAVPRDMHISFRKVPPMQLTLGAGKGVAVKDIQW
ncbi:hypothetical protein MPSEU_001105100 [Mayamaea pseudoterrestris]|nr:hypothetical protein MPSEU_001105100 [Mayamaea pseudoterrestris]